MLALVIAAIVVAVVWSFVANKSPSAPLAQASDDAGAGSDPLPLPRIIDGPNTRFIDLRPLPEEDLNLGRFGAAASLLRVHEPAQTQLFVVSLATARAWLALDDVALVIVLGRLKELRKEPGFDFLHVVGGDALDADSQARFKACGLELALDFHVVGSERSVSIAEALALPDPRRASGPKRPILPYKVRGNGFFAQDLVFEIDRAVFIDLRRAHPAALEKLTALDLVDESLRGVNDDGAKLWIWILAPWVLARFRGRDEAVLARVGAWVERHPGRHRLAIWGGTGDEPLVGRLRALGMKPLGEALELETQAGRFRVPFIKILDDVAAYEATVTGSAGGKAPSARS